MLAVHPQAVCNHVLSWNPTSGFFQKIWKDALLDLFAGFRRLPLWAPTALSRRTCTERDSATNWSLTCDVLEKICGDLLGDDGNSVLTKVSYQSDVTVPALSTQDLGLVPLPCWAKWWNLEMWWQAFGGSLLPRYAPNWYSGDWQKRWEKTEGLDLWQQKKADFSQKMLEVESPQCISIIIYASQHQFMNFLHWSPFNHGGQPSQIHAVSSFFPLTPPAYDIWGRSSLAPDKG